jgi:hypothetical protein
LRGNFSSLIRSSGFKKECPNEIQTRRANESSRPEVQGKTPGGNTGITAMQLNTLS